MAPLQITPVADDDEPQVRATARWSIGCEDWGGITALVPFGNCNFVPRFMPPAAPKKLTEGHGDEHVTVFFSCSPTHSKREYNSAIAGRRLAFFEIVAAAARVQPAAGPWHKRWFRHGRGREAMGSQVERAAGDAWAHLSPLALEVRVPNR
jgi:hypothetical protein